MKRLYIFLIVFLFFGICFLSAHDLIILRDGNIIEAQVMEISPTDIRYKRSEHLDGPTIVIPVANVLSIRYENGMSESIAVPPVSAQINTQAERTQNTALGTNKFIFGINVNPGGVICWFSNDDWGYPSGPSLNIELGRGNFISEINLIFPIGGFGCLFTFNGFWHSQIGGAYLGGGIGYSFYRSKDYNYDDLDVYFPVIAHSLVVGFNAGYKFVTRSGVYFRTGVFAGFNFGLFWGDATNFSIIYIKPDLAIGWTIR